MITGFNHDRPYPPENGAAGRAAPNPEQVEAPPAPAPAVATPAAPPQVPAAQPVLAAPAPVAPAPSPPTVDPVMAAQVHQVTIQAHRRYQELMAESHRNFLSLAARALGQEAGGQSVSVPAMPVAESPALAPAVSAPTLAVAPPTVASVAPP
ncbi:MAG: hypothetical protein ACPHQP_04730, partial [Longimicrobiales bacterium]